MSLWASIQRWWSSLFQPRPANARQGMAEISDGLRTSADQAQGDDLVTRYRTMVFDQKQRQRLWRKAAIADQLDSDKFPPPNPSTKDLASLRRIVNSLAR